MLGRGADRGERASESLNCGFRVMDIEGPNLDRQNECEAILRSLPDWFGIEEALQKYALDSASLPTFGVSDADRLHGFVSLRQHFADSWEVHCIAVHSDSRRSGLGRKLLAHSEGWLVAQGARLLQVKTIAESHPSAAYAQTRRFYQSQGFFPLEAHPTLWGPANPVLQMVKSLPDG